MTLMFGAPALRVILCFCLTVFVLLLFAGVTASSLIFGTRTLEDFLVEAIVLREVTTTFRVKLKHLKFSSPSLSRSLSLSLRPVSLSRLSHVKCHTLCADWLSLHVKLGD